MPHAIDAQINQHANAPKPKPDTAPLRRQPPEFGEISEAMLELGHNLSPVSMAPGRDSTISNVPPHSHPPQPLLQLTPPT